MSNVEAWKKVTAALRDGCVDSLPDLEYWPLHKRTGRMPRRGKDVIRTCPFFAPLTVHQTYNVKGPVNSYYLEYTGSPGCAEEPFSVCINFLLEEISPREALICALDLFVACMIYMRDDDATPEVDEILEAHQAAWREARSLEAASS